MEFMTTIERTATTVPFPDSLGIDFRRPWWRKLFSVTAEREGGEREGEKKTFSIQLQQKKRKNSGMPPKINKILTSLSSSKSVLMCFSSICFNLLSRRLLHSSQTRMTCSLSLLPAIEATMDIRLSLLLDRGMTGWGVKSEPLLEFSERLNGAPTGLVSLSEEKTGTNCNYFFIYPEYGPINQSIDQSINRWNNWSVLINWLIDWSTCMNSFRFSFLT